MRKTSSMIGVLVLAACGGGADAGADAGGGVELKLGHVGAPGSLFDLAATEFARRVEQRSGGKVTIATFGSSQLGGDETLLQKLKLGTVDISLPSTILSSMIDQFGLFEMPYIVRDREHMKRIEESVVWPDLAPLAEARGYRLLAVWENGFRHITNNKRPIVTPADLRGIKLRTPRGVWRVKLFQALGANPTPMAYSEVFMALQTGVMDGQENPLAQIYSGRLHDVQKYLSLTAHVYTPAFVTVGTTRWDRLPEDVQTLVADVAAEMQDFVYETAVRLEEEYLADMVASGIAVNEVDRAAFLAAGQPVYDEFAASVEGGRELIAKAAAAGQR
ncbi:MAG: TRAP transporter substrate-binding protein [Gemmatimonadota bacterium]